jgi:hypothetical protein
MPRKEIIDRMSIKKFGMCKINNNNKDGNQAQDKTQNPS